MGWNHPPGLVLGSAPEVKAVGLPIYHTGVEARLVWSERGSYSPQTQDLGVKGISPKLPLIQPPRWASCGHRRAWHIRGQFDSNWSIFAQRCAREHQSGRPNCRKSYGRTICAGGIKRENRTGRLVVSLFVRTSNLEMEECFTNDRTGTLLADGQGECWKEARPMAPNSTLGSSSSLPTRIFTKKESDSQIIPRKQWEFLRFLSWLLASLKVYWKRFR